MRSKRFLLGLSAGILMLTGCSGDPDISENGDRSIIASAECVFEKEEASYTIFINVTIDKYGNIVSVEDAGTQIAEGKDGKYIQAQTIFDKLIGKNINTIDEVDAVSGATVSCEAIKSAVKAALS